MSVISSSDPAVLGRFVAGLPKVELHLHIEGSLEPELLFALAQRNNRPIKYNDVGAVRLAYDFTNLQTFLDIYYEGMAVLTTEQDFYDLTFAYFTRVHKDNVRHAEIFFDPQAHAERGVGLATVVAGITRAMAAAERELGVTSGLILSFLRHLSEESALETLELAEPLRASFVAVGLDSSEVGHPPRKFERVFAEARRRGYKTVAHGGEEGAADPYIVDAIDVLGVDRLDHGIRCFDCPELVRRLAETQLPLTVCPLSNLKLRTVASLAEHPMKRMLDSGLCATINSDDPAYFAGYMNENYLQTAVATGMSVGDVRRAAANSIAGSFATEARKAELRRELDDYADAFTAAE